MHSVMHRGYTFMDCSINKMLRMGNRRGKWKHPNMVNESVEFVIVGVGSVRCCWESGVVARIPKVVNGK